ncbi:(deoxy)nucleoside triphosphate pyrophosphohydrolase [Lutimonas zeaxanthinifaciens]|uniref:(deoxy)nucleoside triphosphate pyrophosphohydrolase n=1 Tax=Lutimonas zeaxanthinifaciens TaxID=3060215 RepID=UPI00265CA06D|nr:(deoxy)nucleoside triphosphate pyrophosphohydrolase [Lutimonas sp. YSD2104]WKK67483.1 (deoxy)nucleoside triphosphate pyrophosphohydrolase [Lutimonas sp. YSD2104]
MIQVVAAVIKRNGRYFIARRAPHKDHAGKWEFPGGKIELHESPEEALEREIFEEFGVETTTGSYLTKSHFDYGTIEIELLAYECIYVSGAFKLSDHDKIAWVELQEMDRFDMNKADYPIIEFLKKRSQK